MNKNFNFDQPQTTKPSAQRYSTLILCTILIVLLLAFIHLYRYGIHMDIKVPTNSDAIIVKKDCIKCYGKKDAENYMRPLLNEYIEKYLTLMPEYAASHKEEL